MALLSHRRCSTDEYALNKILYFHFSELIAYGGSFAIKTPMVNGARLTELKDNTSKTYQFIIEAIKNKVRVI